MPGLSGKELAIRAKKMFEHVKVVFMSGHTNDIIAKQGVLHTDEIRCKSPSTRSISSRN